MAVAQVVCPHCGWQNAASARMCAGCGRPLATALASGGPGAIRYPQGEEPTDPDIQAQTARGGAPQPSLAAGQSARGCLGRGAVVVGILALVVLFGCAALWGVVLRPALHASVDSQIRSQLQTAVDQANSQMPAVAQVLDTLPNKKGQNQVTAAALNQSIAATIPAQSPVQHMHVSFPTGQVMITFTTFGSDGSISTHLTSQNKRPFASGTTVTGLLTLVESADDIENDMNSAFANLQPTVAVTGIDLGGDVMTITLQSSQ